MRRAGGGEERPAEGWSCLGHVVSPSPLAPAAGVEAGGGSPHSAGQAPALHLPVDASRPQRGQQGLAPHVQALMRCISHLRRVTNHHAWLQHPFISPQFCRPEVWAQRGCVLCSGLTLRVCQLCSQILVPCMWVAEVSSCWLSARFTLSSKRPPTVPSQVAPLSPEPA